jgi:hypothetical protein
MTFWDIIAALALLSLGVASGYEVARERKYRGPDECNCHHDLVYHDDSRRCMVKGCPCMMSRDEVRAALAAKRASGADSHGLPHHVDFSSGVLLWRP